jgi:hypothetical protein
MLLNDHGPLRFSKIVKTREMFENAPSLVSREGQSKEVSDNHGCVIPETDSQYWVVPQGKVWIIAVARRPQSGRLIWYQIFVVKTRLFDAIDVFIS